MPAKMEVEECSCGLVGTREKLVRVTTSSVFVSTSWRSTLKKIKDIQTISRSLILWDLEEQKTTSRNVCVCVA